MTRFLVPFAFILCLAGCNGTNPFDDEEAPSTTEATETPAADTTTAATDTGQGIISSVATLPGTANPTSSTAIFRSEATSDTGDNFGNGYAQGFAYDNVNDTFTVDNIAFDGDSPYTAVIKDDGQKLGIGPFSVFEAPATATDTLTAATVAQLDDYRALYAISADGNSSIAIVRTGAYIPYGFGGYVYQRNGSVVLPTSGQAVYKGTDNYGGLRDFAGRGGLEYVKGDMTVNIDFDDFNDGAGVSGVVSNRQVYALDDVLLTATDAGNVTQDILDNLAGSPTELPLLKFNIGPGVMDANGELSGNISSNLPDGSGIYESGNYYAILSGDNATTITGIVVVTSTDPRYGGTVRETGGFFAVRE